MEEEKAEEKEKEGAKKGEQGPKGVSPSFPPKNLFHYLPIFSPLAAAPPPPPPLSWGRDCLLFLGSGPIRRQSPVEWGEIP